MSAEIDMRNFAGAMEPDAAVQQVVDNNSYQQEAIEALDLPQDAFSQTENLHQTQKSPQELNFEAFRDEIRLLKEEREKEKQEHRQQLEMLRANAQQAYKPEPPKEMFHGMNSDDIPNVADIRREWSQKEAQYQARIEELSVAQQYPDYQEVMQKYVQPLINEKPHLIRGALSSENKAMALYELGKLAEGSMKQSQISTVNQNAQKIVENSKKIGTLSQAGGQSVLGKADYYASMSDSEFAKFAAKNMGEI